MLDEAKIEDLTDTATLVNPVLHSFDYPLDPKDEPYIDLAIESGSAFLVSWDKHLDSLEPSQ